MCCCLFVIKITLSHHELWYETTKKKKETNTEYEHLTHAPARQNTLAVPGWLNPTANTPTNNTHSHTNDAFSPHIDTFWKATVRTQISSPERGSGVAANHVKRIHPLHWAVHALGQQPIETVNIHLG